MSGVFSFDVFLSHSSKDKPVVRELADRLKKDGVCVWLDEEQIKPGDSIPAKIEEGLERSRILMLCMSVNAFGSDWAKLEADTFRFRDPLNKERRFIPLRLDNTRIKGSLDQFLYVDWRPRARDQEYGKLLSACQLSKPAKTKTSPEQQAARERLEINIRSLGHTDSVTSVAWSPDGKQALSGANDHTVRLWEVTGSRCLRVFEGHTSSVLSVAWSPDGKQALSGAKDHTVRLWEVTSGRCLRVFKGHTGSILSVVWSPDGKQALSGADDYTLRLWEVDSGRCLRILEGHTGSVFSVAWSPDGKLALTGAYSCEVHVWEVTSGRCLRMLDGHTGSILSVAWSPDGKQALSGAFDHTVRLWDVTSGRCLRMFGGHTGIILSVAWSPDGKRLISGSDDHTVRLWKVDSGRCLRVLEGHTNSLLSMAWSPDGKLALSGANDRTMRLWEVDSGRCLRVLEGHTNGVLSVAWSPDGKHVLSGAYDHTLRLWEVITGKCLRVFKGPTASVRSVAWSPDGKQALSGANDYTVRLWEVDSGRCLRTFDGHTGNVRCVAWSPDGRRALSANYDHTLRLWEVDSGKCLRVLEGHTDRVLCGAWNPDGKRVLSGALDYTVRLWEVDSGRCLRVLEGHTNRVLCVAWNPDGKQALSGAEDHTLRLWDVDSGRCLRVLEGHTDGVRSVAWSLDGKRASSVALNGVWREWDLATFDPKTHSPAIVTHNYDSLIHSVLRKWVQIEYTNAKVLLVGETSAGKTGLSNYLAHGIQVEDGRPLPSTDGAWATHWPLKHDQKKSGVEREIWLWDFAGQLDYRLVHQLHMENAAVAVVVFDPQKEDLFEGLGRWDRDIQNAAGRSLAKLLVAGRVDRGGLTVSAASMDTFLKERGFLAPLHLTSAKTGEGCDALRDAIEKAIDWDHITVTSSPALYRRIKQEILKLRDSGMVLIRLAELKQRMEMTLGDEDLTLEELKTVVGLLAGPGMIQQLDFGGLILLQPEVLSRYAAAVVRKVRKHPQELGCIREDELLTGNLDYQDFKRLESQEDEKVVLRALLEQFISRAWCLRQPCDGTAILTFPSYFRRERKEQPSHPSVLVTYRFDGPADDIYTTLVVRLHHTVAFESAALWRSAADFKTQSGANLGFTMQKEGEGRSKLEVYFEPNVDDNSRVLFLRYIHDHLISHGTNVVRLRRYSCKNRKCDSFEQPFSDQSKIDKALSPNGKGKVFCPDCGKPIQLRDLLEEKFHSPATIVEARKLEAEAQLEIDNESRELMLVGHTTLIVAEAGQIYRGYTNSDHGIDGEIEFKNDDGQATGKRLYLQLKSGDSYLTTRKADGAEVFQIKKPRWAEYWQEQAYPVMLVIRTSDGEIRWMDVSAYLKHESSSGKTVKQIIFDSEPFDTFSVRRWRDSVLKESRR